MCLYVLSGSMGSAANESMTQKPYKTKDSFEKSIIFKQINDVDTNDFFKAMEIYTEAFPSCERHDITVIQKRVRMKINYLYIGYLNHEIVFFALLYPIKQTAFTLLDYMATDSKYRGRGIGKQFIRYLISMLKENHIHYLMEVEDPREGTNRIQRKIRIQFYTKFGAKTLENVQYIIPPLSGETATPARLMILSASNQTAISGKQVKNLITEIYHNLYPSKEYEKYLHKIVENIPDSFINLI